LGGRGALSQCARDQLQNFAMFPTNVQPANYSWPVICTGGNTYASNYSPWQVVTMGSTSTNSFILRLTLASDENAGANALILGVQVSPSANGHIESSTDLIDWQPLTNFTGPATNGLFQTAATNNTGRCFYRAVIPQTSKGGYTILQGTTASSLKV
jgi:hypothetical protein